MTSKPAGPLPGPVSGPHTKGDPVRTRWWHCHRCATVTGPFQRAEDNALDHALVTGHTTVYGEQWSRTITPLRTEPEVTP